MTVIGQLATPASVTFALYVVDSCPHIYMLDLTNTDFRAEMIFAAVTIGTDGRFVASNHQILGLYVGLTVALGILNSLPTRTLHKITSLYGTLSSSTSFMRFLYLTNAVQRISTS